MLASAIEQGIDPTRPTTPRRRSRARSARGAADYERQAVARCTPTTTRYSRLDVGDARDAAVRQHGLRAADARRRPALRVADGAPARRAHVARQAGRVDRPRLARRLAARHGRRVRDLRCDGHLREADGDHEGRSCPAARSTRLAAGASRRRSARSPKASRGR